MKVTLVMIVQGIKMSQEEGECLIKRTLEILDLGAVKISDLKQRRDP